MSDELPNAEDTEQKRGRRLTVFLVVGLVNVGLLALLASQLLTAAPQQGQAQTGLGVVSSPLDGRPAPDFTLPALSPTPAPALHLASLKGRPVMLNFWASWCDPCKQEAPPLESSWQRVQKQGGVFVGIDMQDTQRDGLGFLGEYAITYPNVVDTNGAVTINYGVTGTPETFFVDRRGVVVRKVIGAIRPSTLQESLRLIGLVG
jgi:cytochrome c biogenesis protein CcmG, thiol:disulfide interchange protein DsbE